MVRDSLAALALFSVACACAGAWTRAVTDSADTARPSAEHGGGSTHDRLRPLVPVTARAYVGRHAGTPNEVKVSAAVQRIEDGSNNHPAV